MRITINELRKIIKEVVENTVMEAETGAPEGSGRRDGEVKKGKNGKYYVWSGGKWVEDKYAGPAGYGGDTHSYDDGTGKFSRGRGPRD